MGYFGRSLTASDAYMDYESMLLGFLGWKFNDSDDYDPDDYKPHNERIGKEGFEGRVEEIVEWMKFNEMTFEDGLFFTYHLLIRGVDVSNERLDKLIQMFMEDEWAKVDGERRIYMNLAIEAIEKYKTDKTPVDIDYCYDFTNYYILQKTNPEISTVKEIIEFFEKYAGIKVKSKLRTNYDLFFVVSQKDFIKIKGESIMGIKFLTHIKA